MNYNKQKNKMKQLKLTESELFNIGFKKCETKADKLNPTKIFFKLDTINGYFYYNHSQKKYTWYYKTIIGNIANNIHLDIITKAELFVILQSFKTKFNLIF